MLYYQQENVTKKQEKGRKKEEEKVQSKFMPCETIFDAALFLIQVA